MSLSTVRGLPLIVLAAVAGLTCTTREPLPPVSTPLTPTPDAAFRRRAPLPWDDERAFDGIQVEEQKLRNGLVIQIVERPDIPLVSLVYVNHAAELQAGVEPGLATLTARTMLGGILVDDGTVLTGIRIGGVEPSASVGDSGTSIGFSLVSSGTTVAIEALASIIQRPAFDAVSLRESVAEIANEIYDEEASLFGTARSLAARAAFGDEHRLGIDASEYLRSLQSIEQKRVREFYDREYTPDRSALIIVGDVDAADLLPVIERRFGAWQLSRPASGRSDRMTGGSSRGADTQPVERVGRRRIYALLADSEQAYVLLPQRAVGPEHPDHLALNLLAKVLAGGFSSRANLALRHGSGLTYGVSTAFAGNSDARYLSIRMAVERNKVLAGVRQLEDVLERLQRETVTRSELEAARTAYLSEFDVSTNRGIAGLLAGLFAQGLSPKWLANLETETQKIDPDDLQRVASRYLRPDGNVVVLGNYFENGNLLRSLGRVILFRRRR